MYGKDQWRGREVEGRYSDMMTYFIRDLGNGINVDNLQTYPHYYFTIEYMESAKNSDNWQNKQNLYDPIRAILDTTNCVVTIEANSNVLENLPPDIFNRCHVIYRIQDESLQKLKDTDTFSVDAGWYRVHQVTKCNMMEIKPDNYKFDEDV
tara:strand:+ start:1765 stop:2217 length:453 start_codon:yes stop_codon:yes gene_type:complete